MKPSESEAAAVIGIAEFAKNSAPLVGLMIDTVGGSATTLMLIGVDSVVANRSSVARTVRRCVPAGALLHVNENGGPTVPIFCPSEKKSSTVTLLSLSLASTAMEMLAGCPNVEPLVGTEIATF